MEENKKLEQTIDSPERRIIKREVIHFTDAPDIQHFAAEKVHKNDNAYGVTWANLVKEYLKTAYSEESKQAEIVAWGVTYKVLRREDVTAFYDVDGNTIFDVENTRLEREYSWVMNEEAMEVSEDGVEPVTPMGKTITAIERQAFDAAMSEEGGEATEEQPGKEGDTLPVDETEKQKNSEEIKAQAKKKLEDELIKAEDKTFADPVIKHLLKRCEEDGGLSEDVLQEHKTWKKCMNYIYDQARKQATGNRCAIRDDVVYEWAEDYFHRDDKAEEERKAKREAERKKKTKNANKGKSKVTDSKTSKKKEIEPSKKAEGKTEKKMDAQLQPKKKAKEMDGQMDFFSLMGL